MKNHPHSGNVSLEKKKKKSILMVTNIYSKHASRALLLFVFEFQQTFTVLHMHKSHNMKENLSSNRLLAHLFSSLAAFHGETKRQQPP